MTKNLYKGEYFVVYKKKVTEMKYEYNISEPFPTKEKAEQYYEFFDDAIFLAKIVKSK